MRAAMGRVAWVAVVLTGLGWGAQAQAADPPPAQLTQWLNAQRSANGLPTVAHDPARVDGCSKHLNYARLNGGLDHGEDPSKPGYTPEGADSTGELLGGQAQWSPTTTPWETGPLHLASLFSPVPTQGGGATEQGSNCYRLGGTRTFSKPKLYAYPGRGAKGVPYETTTGKELPFHPSTLVGLSGTVGHPIILWAMGGSNAPILRRAVLRGPGGAKVAVKKLDRRTKTPSGTWSSWVGSRTAMVAPVKPLKPGTKYVLDVVLSHGFKRRVVFTTRAGAVTLPLSVTASKSGAVTITTDAKAVGQVVTVEPLILRPDGNYDVKYKQEVTITGPTTTAQLPPEQLAPAARVEANLKPFTSGGTAYSAKMTRADVTP